jgi:hypothetical protein
MQTYLETGQTLSTLLEQARRVGEVRIRREDGETFVLKPEKAKQSALDVEGIDLDISTSEIIEFIHEGRKPL